MGVYGKGRNEHHKGRGLGAWTRRGKALLGGAKILRATLKKQKGIIPTAADNLKAIDPHRLGFKLAGNEWVGKVRVEMKPGPGATRGFSKEIELSFILERGFIKKRTLKVNGTPSSFGESRLHRLNGALLYANHGTQMPSISLSPEMIEALLGKKI